MDGSPARQLQRIATGLRLKEVAPPTIVRNGAQTPEQIRATVNAAIAAAPERYILGADCTLPTAIDLDHIRAVVEATAP